jgi:hypothetical protein
VTQLYGVLAGTPVGHYADRAYAERRGGGPTFNAGPRQNPSQGDNPNVALTRPHIIGPLTLVGR